MVLLGEADDAEEGGLSDIDEEEEEEEEEIIDEEDEGDEDIINPQETLQYILRFLQLLCEGHNIHLQN